MFKAVGARLAGNRQQRLVRKTGAAASPLTGKIFDADGQPMRPTFGHGRGKKISRYYVGETLLPNGQIGPTDNLGASKNP